MIPLHIDVNVGTLELGAARDAVLRHRRPKEYVIRTLLGLAMLGGVGLLYASMEDPEGVARGLVALTLLALTIIPWTGQRMSALIAGLAPYTIVGLLPHGMNVRAKGVESEQSFEALPIKLETKTLFVLSSDNGSRVLTIPKHVFPDTETLAAVRAAIFSPSVPSAVIDAVRVFGQLPSVRFALAPDESRHVRRLLLGPKLTLGLSAAGAIVAIGLGYVFYAVGPLEGCIVSVVLAVGLRQSLTPTRSKSEAALAEITLEIDADVFRLISTSGGSVSYPWATVPLVIEDDKVLIIVTRAGNVPIPKRVLSNEMSALIRSRVAAAR